MLFERRAPEPRAAGRGALLSACAHCGLALVAIAIATRAPATAIPTSGATPPPGLEWIPATAAPAAGGGQGGGSRSPKPVQRAEATGRDALTVPAAPAPAPTPRETAPIEPLQALALSAQPLASGVQPHAGVVASDAPADGTQGVGAGPGADGDKGPGIGAGRSGAGIGPGRDGETGGEGPPGAGVSWPRLIRDVRPAYTSEAMRARITGSVGLSCVVDRDGTVRDCRLTRSLDSVYGLDQAAMVAARQWRFEPSRRGTEPVAVRVGIEMAFSLR